MFKLLITILLWIDLVTSIKSNFYDYKDDDMRNKDYQERAPLDFGYTVLLYNSKVPHRTCVGVIITKWWIIDNCMNFPRYHYDVFKVGWGNPTKQIETYKIVKNVCHKHYKRIDFNNSSFDVRNLFAAFNALCLHRSRNQIKFIPETIRAVKINNLEIVPKRGYVVYYPNGTLLKKRVPIVSSKRCDNHFRPYFHKNQQISLEKKLLCINPKGIASDSCCNSQAIIVSDNILVGILAWSTSCSEEFGFDPWVFTSIGHYISWIASNTDWETFKDK